MREKEEKVLYISNIRKGVTVNDFFILTSFKKKLKRDGNPYITIEIADKSGRIEGKIWDNISEIESILKPGSIYRIRAFSNEYQGKLELRIDGIKIFCKQKPIWIKPDTFGQIDWELEKEEPCKNIMST